MEERREIAKGLPRHQRRVFYTIFSRTRRASALAEQRAEQIREMDQCRSKRFPTWGEYATAAGLHSYASATQKMVVLKEASPRRGEPELNRPNVIEVPVAVEHSIGPPAQTNHEAAAQEDVSQDVRDAFMRAQEERKSR